MKNAQKIMSMALIASMLVGCQVNKSTNISGTISITESIQSTTSEQVFKKGSIKQDGLTLYPKSVNGYVGDPMPFYDNGEMNIFYLQDGRNTTLGFHPFALMTTTDYITFNDYGKVIPYEDDLESPDFALGTGSIIKDKNGLYHCFYTGHNSRKNSGLPFYEKIQHATSVDKINWEKHPEDGFFGDSNDFRDPYVYLGEDNVYHMLITTRDKGVGVIKEYVSNDLSNFEYKGIFFRNDSGSYNMECPTFIKYNGYYYLSYSEQGSLRVVHYRYKKNLEDDWIKPECDYLDGAGFYAGRIEKADDKLIMAGWCGTRVGEYDFGEYDWGGNLIVHELKQKENGELEATLFDSIKEKLNHKVSYKLNNGGELESMEFSSETQKSYCVEALSKNTTRISFDVDLNEVKGSLGLSFSTISNDHLSNEIIALNFDTGNLTAYCNAESFDKYGKVDSYVPFKFEKGILHVEMIIEKNVVTTYLDGKIALTTRFYDMPKSIFSFFMNKCDAEFKNIQFFE